MDDFIAELEKNINKIGAEKVWKRRIGDTEVWFSPISLYAQEKIAEMMNNSEQMGMNVLHETKHLMLSYAISGINGIDFRPYKDVAPYFPITGKDGKMTKVTLDKYLYHKMTNWSGQFIDDAFSVYTDLIETHQKENLANIKFENSKTPEEELADLEARVAELRKELNKPSPEAQPEPDVKPPPTADPAPVMSVEFDPFAKIESMGTQTTPPPPDVSTKQAVADEADRNLFGQSIPGNPQSMNPNVIDNRSATGPTAPPIVNAPVNRNPRFNPQR